MAKANAPNSGLAQRVRRVRQAVGSFISGTSSGTPAIPTLSASGGNPYESAATTRRTAGWQPSRLGPTTNLWGTLDLSRARCRDEVRNNPWAASAVDNFESQVIGNGIRPRWNIENARIKTDIEAKWKRWAERVNFYALEATVAREIFEAGEVFVRRLIRPLSWGLDIPLDLELIEGEQVPVFLNTISGGQPGTPQENSIRTGIEFDPNKRIAAYHMYKEHPGETMFYPLSGLTYVRIPAADILHPFKPLRAGMLRGQPHLTPVLTTLHEIGTYMDAAIVKKQIQTMFAGFIHKVDPGSDLLPIDSTIQTSGNGSDPSLTTPAPSYDPGIQASRIETGTMQVLFPGEEITFPSLPQENDIETFLSVCLHQFAVGIGATYESITGDLRGVNLSSIRVGAQDARRKIMQFQRNVIINQFVMPVVYWWMQEGVMSGALNLPGFASDPTPYTNIDYNTPGWDWISPLEEAKARQIEVRSGFTSREAVVTERGGEVEVVDAQQVADNNRADAAGLVYDSDSRLTLNRTELNASNKDNGEEAGTPSEDEEAGKREVEEEGKAEDTGFSPGSLTRFPKRIP